ncbi:MAG: hypothetical protein NDJ19_07815 [Ramlibacter sp.]|nr:hypothetical protein [Ramlibacter sp.]
MANRGIVQLELGAGAGHVGIIAADAGRKLPLPIGSSHLVRLFRRDPPRPVDLEEAIEVTEDAVMPLARLLPPDSVLRADDPLTRQVALRAAGSDAVQSVSLDAIEALFGQLADAAQRGFWSGELRLDPTEAAALVILREFMHHAGFDSIELGAGEGDAA